MRNSIATGNADDDKELDVQWHLLAVAVAGPGRRGLYEPVTRVTGRECTAIELS